MIYSVIANELKIFYRELTNIIFVFILPVLLLIVLGYIMPNEFEQYFYEITNESIEHTSEFSPDRILTSENVITSENTLNYYGKYTDYQIIDSDNLISLKDYYGTSILIMITFMATIISANSFSEEYRLKTINRLIISGTSPKKIFWNIYIGMAIVEVFALIIFWIAASLIFNITFAPSIKEQIIIFFLSVLNSLTLLIFGATLGLFIRRNPLPYIMPFFTVMMFLGGTFSNTLYIKGISEAMPIYHMRTIFFEISLIHNYRSVSVFLIIEFLLFIFFSVLAVNKFNKIQIIG